MSDSTTRGPAALESFDPERETCAQWAQRQLNTIAAQSDGDPHLHRDRLLDVLDAMTAALRAGALTSLAALDEAIRKAEADA